MGVDVHLAVEGHAEGGGRHLVTSSQAVDTSMLPGPALDVLLLLLLGMLLAAQVHVHCHPEGAVRHNHGGGPQHKAQLPVLQEAQHHPATAEDLVIQSQVGREPCQAKGSCGEKWGSVRAASETEGFYKRRFQPKFGGVLVRKYTADCHSPQAWWIW